MKVLSTYLLEKWRYLAIEDNSIQRIIATVESPSIYMVKRYGHPFTPEVLTIWGIGDTKEEALERGRRAQITINDQKNNK